MSFEIHGIRRVIRNFRRNYKKRFSWINASDCHHDSGGLCGNRKYKKYKMDVRKIKITILYSHSMNTGWPLMLTFVGVMFAWGVAP
ncbi:MAG: hypothetical protein IIB44_11795 [Candidatus Marinimicrobia bacterium]|nr:hypothetical protein [Candidatus Neomarinimicrobiota bacterium]